MATTGDDANPGTQDLPFRTITRGVSVLRPGDTPAGERGDLHRVVHRHHPRRNVVVESVKLAAWAAETVIIQPAPGSDFVFRFQSEDDSFIVIDGLIIDAVNVSYDAVKITYSSSADHHIRLTNSEIKNSPGNGILITRSHNLVPKHNQFVNINVHDNGKTDFAHGLYIASGHTVLRNSSIHHNAGWGVKIYNGDYPELTATTTSSETTRFSTMLASEIGGRESSSPQAEITAPSTTSSGATQAESSSTTARLGPRRSTTPCMGTRMGIYVGDGSRHAAVRNNIVFQNDDGGVIDDGRKTAKDMTRYSPTRPRLISISSREARRSTRAQRSPW